MELDRQATVYQSRNVQETSLWRLLNGHFSEFESCYDRRFCRDYGFYRPIISHVVSKYLECCDLHEGRRSLAMLAYLPAFVVQTVTMNICSLSPAVVVGSGVSFLAYLPVMPQQKGGSICPSSKRSGPLSRPTPPIRFQYSEDLAQVFSL